MEHADLTYFDLSPISMWLQDFSGVKTIFNRWKAEGIQDLEAFLMEDTQRLFECLETIHTLHVNKSTLRLYEAQDLDEILAHFIAFLTPEVTEFQIKFFCALWNGNAHCAIPVVNYTCKGKQIDIQLSATIVPGYEESWEMLMLTTEEISAYQQARRFAESVFLHSPTALWVKDYSLIKARFDQLRTDGIQHLNAYIEQHPEFLRQSFELIQSKQINQAFQTLFKIDDQQDSLQQLNQLFTQNNDQYLYHQLMHLWNGQHHLQREYEYTLPNGAKIFVLEQLNIFPDAQDSWRTIQVSFTDLTERKLLEDHLHYLSQYDQLTQLHNRTFFNEEIQRLQQQQIYPIACIYMDLNGLKVINDVQGHHHGDLMLKRFGNILIDATQNKACSVSRIGGDEFVVLMPKANLAQAEALMQEIEHRILVENHHNAGLSVAMGIAYSEQFDHLESLIKLADQNMYQSKRKHYQMMQQ